MNSRERRTARYRAKCAAEGRLEKSIAIALTGCTSRVYKATMPVPVRSSEQLTELKFKPHNKVKNPLGQQVNARQKMRGKSIPLI